MDYTIKEVRASLYRERADINEFDIHKKWSVSWSMHSAFICLRITDLENQDECIVACYNNAYYIVTVILQENTPEHYIAQYMKIAMTLPTDNDLYRVQYAALTIALVVNILQRCEKRYQNPYDSLRQLLDDCVKRECNKLEKSIETYLDYLERIDDVTTEKTMKYTINRSDFIPLNQQTEKAPVSVDPEDPSSLLARIEELEKIIEEKDKTIKELNENIKTYQFRKMPPAKRKGIALGLTPIQADIFGDYLASKLGIYFGNKKEELSIILNSLFGHGISSLKNKMSEIATATDDRLYVASIFGPSSPETAKAISSDWTPDTPAPWAEDEKDEEED